MMLARYGGGAGMKQIGDILNIPIVTAVRLIGAAVVATGHNKGLGAANSQADDAANVKALEDKLRAQGLKV